MIFHSLAFCLLFSGFTFAMEDIKESAACSQFTQEYVFGLDNFYHRNKSLELCKKIYGDKPITETERQNIRKDLALLHIDDTSIELYTANGNCTYPWAFVDYQKDNPILALWIPQDPTNARYFDNLRLILCIALIKQQPSLFRLRYDETTLNELWTESTVQSIRVLLDNKDKRGKDNLMEVLEDYFRKEGSHKETPFPVFSLLPDSARKTQCIKHLKDVFQEAVTQYELTADLFTENENEDLAQDIGNRAGNYWLAYIIHERLAHLDSKKNPSEPIEKLAAMSLESI